MANCDTWVSSYRLVLALVQSIGSPTAFQASDVLEEGNDAVTNATWDLFFVRISGLQEYGFHSGLEKLIWATDALGSAFIELDWSAMQVVLTEMRSIWTETIIRHAKDEGEFFPDRARPLDENGADAT
ncbi:hypothetical protein [Lichenihabitans psoromatis]|uniref:hypothetical protein n=1 Tax=Lichenihabitans psoromatis TaxID=2528642 RepID=UPI001038443F|nr:hypothetical protein [Lichenihabitans psoromatis]